MDNRSSDSQALFGQDQTFHISVQLLVGNVGEGCL